uniref:Protein kinase domain-containing protein n=1 Tax=Heterorhabditis bacteriophora TaxID=37862 RepID=A0A1I7WS77_HETBA
MVFGRPPFMSIRDDPNETQHRIKNWQRYLDVSSRAGGGHLSRECINMICQLCCDKADRIGSGGAREVMEHPWFRVRFLFIRFYLPAILFNHVVSTDYVNKDIPNIAKHYNNKATGNKHGIVALEQTEADNGNSPCLMLKVPLSFNPYNCTTFKRLDSDNS